MNVGIVLGTRPEIIKISPLLREHTLDYSQIHTGQHYSYELDRAFYNDLELSEPDYNLNVGSGSHAVQTSKIMTGVEQILQKESINIVLVQGDTNTVLAGSLATVKLNIPVGHVEAGLRSFDRTMPEEINRIVSDHISELLFAPTEQAKNNLLTEGIPEHKIHVTGNTIVDAVYQNLELAKKTRNPLQKYNLNPKEYFLVTAHRAENTDNPNRLNNIIHALEQIHAKYQQPILYPIHPRTKKMLNQYNIKPKNIQLIEPVGYLDFLLLQSHAQLILTDSGGVQEESCILKTPCVTLRDNTERPETIQTGANTLAGTTLDKILQATEKMLNAPTNWTNPFGDGTAAKQIIKIISDYKSHPDKTKI